MNHTAAAPLPSPPPRLATITHQGRRGLGALLLTLLAACGGGGGGDTTTPGAGASTPTNTGPTNVALVEASSAAVGALTVSWLPASDDRTPAAAMRYEVHVSTDAGFTPGTGTQVFTGVGVTSAVIGSGLQAGQAYTVRLVALDADGARSVSRDSLQATVSDTAATGVAGVQVQTLAAAQVASVTANTVVLQAGAAVPAVGSFISSADANGGLGYLRKVVAVTQVGGVATLQTAAASINEVVSDLKVSSAFRMDTVSTEVAAVAVQGGLAVVVGATAGGVTPHSFHWPASGLRYSTGVAKAQAPGQVGLLVSAGFKASVSATETGQWGQVAGDSHVDIEVGASGESKLRLSIVNNDVPFTSSTAVSVCRVEVGEVSNDGDDGDASKLTVSAGDLTTLSSNGNRITEADQVLTFKAQAGAASATPYKLVVTAYYDDSADQCNGGNLGGLWREAITMPIEVFVTSNAFPSAEAADLPYQGSAGFTVHNKVVTTFSPKVLFDKTLAGSKLTYARLGLEASPLIEQTLTINAFAAGSLDQTQPVIAPRKFVKVYVTPAGVPIIVSGVFTLDLHIEGQVNGQLDAEEKLTIGYDKIAVGLEYKNGAYQAYQSATPVYKLKVGGNGRAEADLTITLLPALEITAYEVLTGRAVIDPHVTANAGIEGHVTLDVARDFNAEQVNMAADADYRLTRTDLSVGMSAWLYADFHLWDTMLAQFPGTASKDDYTSYHQVNVVADGTRIFGLPALSASLPEGAGTRHPSDSRLIKVRARADNVANPLFPLLSATESFIRWVRWTAPRLIAPLGTPVDSYRVVADPDGEEGVFWVGIQQPGAYTLRVGGYSNWGTWARQYTELPLEIADANNNGIADWWETRYGLSGTGAAMAAADPDGDGISNLQEWQRGSDPSVRNTDAGAIATVTQTPASPSVGEAVLWWINDAWASVKSVVWNFGDGLADQVAQVIDYASAAVGQVFSTAGVKTVVATFKDAAGAVLGTVSSTVTVQPATVRVDSVSPLVATAGATQTFTVTGIGLAEGLAIISIDGCEGVVSEPGGSATRRDFSCTFPANTAVGLKSGTVTRVLDVGNPFGQALKAFQVDVSAAATGTPRITAAIEVSPAAPVVGDLVSFVARGEFLLGSGWVFKFMNLDACGQPAATPTTMTATEMRYSCTVTHATNLIGSVSVVSADLVSQHGSAEIVRVGCTAGNTLDTSNGQCEPTANLAQPLPAAGASDQQCYQAGSDVLVACTSAGAQALNPRQDGARANVSRQNFARVASYDLSECVRDTVTGLVWEGKPTTGPRANTQVYTNFDRAGSDIWDGSQYITLTADDLKAPTNSLGYVEQVNASALCGFTDWRRPTVWELQTLINYGGSASAAPPAEWFVNDVGFNRDYWTNAPYELAAMPWNVGFDTGSTFGRIYRNGKLRLVGGSQTAPWPRYRVATDGQSVSDLKTGLTWQRCVQGTVWDGTACVGTPVLLSHEAALALTATGSWRLATIRELADIVDFSNPATMMPPSFGGANRGLFWTSSPYVRSPSSAWGVDTWRGSTGSHARTDAGYVRLVK